ncbi:MAG TPA: hypothetical protein VIQ05_09630 [Tardiphaga sp.]
MAKPFKNLRGACLIAPSANLAIRPGFAKPLPDIETGNGGLMNRQWIEMRGTPFSMW